MKKPTAIKVAIAHGHAMERAGLKSIIEQHSNYNVAVEAATGSELIRQLKSEKAVPGICIVDLGITMQNGYATLLTLMETWPELKVIILSMYNHEELVTRILRAGAASFLYKNNEEMLLMEAIEQVIKKGHYFTNAVSKLVLQKTKKQPEITDKELQFLYLCAKDLPYKVIASEMGIKPRSVENYRVSLFSKLGVHTKTGLVNFVIESGLVNLCIESSTPR